jgi:P-type Ca2+ transporter type 2C
MDEFFHGLTDIAHARTEMFFLFIIVEIIIALNFRSMRYSIFQSPPHTWLVLAAVWEIALVAVLVQIPSVREALASTSRLSAIWARSSVSVSSSSSPWRSSRLS